MPLDAQNTDLATTAFLRRKAMLAEAQGTQPSLLMAGDSACRPAAVLDLLEAAASMMGDDPMQRLIRAHIAATECEISGGIGQEAEETFHEAIQVFEDVPAEIIDRLNEMAEAA